MKTKVGIAVYESITLFKDWGSSAVSFLAPNCSDWKNIAI